MKDNTLNNMLYELRSDFKKTTDLLEKKIEILEDEKDASCWLSTDAIIGKSESLEHLDIREKDCFRQGAFWANGVANDTKLNMLNALVMVKDYLGSDRTSWQEGEFILSHAVEMAISKAKDTIWAVQ